MTSFKTVVDKHFGLISRSLLDAPARRPTAPPHAAGEAWPGQDGPGGITVAPEFLTSLGAGSVFVDGRAPPSRAFHIYRARDGEHGGAFGYDGTIVSGDAVSDFVGAAYEAILGRHADGMGRTSYEAALQKGFLTREQILRRLASSDEARARGVALAIVPQTSPLLSRWPSPPRAIRLATEAVA